MKNEIEYLKDIEELTNFVVPEGYAGGRAGGLSTVRMVRRDQLDACIPDLVRRVKADILNDVVLFVDDKSGSALASWIRREFAEPTQQPRSVTLHGDPRDEHWGGATQQEKPPAFLHNVDPDGDWNSPEDALYDEAGSSGD